jgi:hypothetical protein
MFDKTPALPAFLLRNRSAFEAVLVLTFEYSEQLVNQAVICLTEAANIAIYSRRY